MHQQMNERNPRTRRLIGILAYCAFLVGLDSLVVAPLVPAITSSTHTPADQGGLLVTAYALFYGLCAPLIGPLSDQWGRRKMIMAGLLTFGIGTAATGFATTFSELLLFRAIAGIGGAMTMPTIFALIGDSFPYQMRGKAMGIVTGAFAGSTVLGVPLGSWFAYLGSWQWTFWAVGILTLIALIVTLTQLSAHPLKQDLQTNPVANYRRQFKMAFTNPSVFFALLSTFLWMASLQGMFAYIGVYYKQNFNLNEAQTGFVILVAGLSNVIGSLSGGRLSDKIGKKRVVVFASVATAAGVISLSLLVHFLVAAIIAHVIWSAACGFGQSSLTALVSELSPEVRGTVLSLNSSAMNIGTMTATAIAAALLPAGGFALVGFMSGVASLLVWPIISYLVKDRVAEKKERAAEVL